MKLSRTAEGAIAVISFNREDAEWAKYKNKQGGI